MWEQAEASVQKAEDALEALIGPFRLNKMVREALTRGMLMPFSVSVHHGKAAARLKEGQNMREASITVVLHFQISKEKKKRMLGYSSTY